MKLSCIDALTPGQNLKERVENLERYGFEGIELWLMEGEDLKKRAKEIKEITSSSRVKPSSLIVSGLATNLLLDNESSMKKKAKLIKESLSIASEINVIAFTPVEYVPQISPPIFMPSVPNESEEKLLINLLRDVGRFAEDLGVILAIEVTNRYESHFFHTLGDAIKICKEVGKDNIKIMADTFHMNIEEENIAQSIERANEHISHIHLSDNNRLLPGYGHIDFRSVFVSLKKIRYKKYMTLECAIPGKPEEELFRCAKHLKKQIAET
jgi:sugar phosphate isomerase/epimerase